MTFQRLMNGPWITISDLRGCDMYLDGIRISSTILRSSWSFEIFKDRMASFGHAGSEEEDRGTHQIGMVYIPSLLVTQTQAI